MLLCHLKTPHGDIVRHLELSASNHEGPISLWLYIMMEYLPLSILSLSHTVAEALILYVQHR